MISSKPCQDICNTTNAIAVNVTVQEESNVVAPVKYVDPISLSELAIQSSSALEPYSNYNGYINYHSSSFQVKRNLC